MNCKQCTKCSEILDLSSFAVRKQYKDGLSYWCKSCIKDNKKKNYSLNLEKERATRRVWNDRNREQKAAYQRTYLSKRYQNDIQFRLRKNIRCRTKQLISSYFSSSKYLGCSFEQFKQYLESKFQPGMSWDNYGLGVDKWTVDHIVPLSKFNLEIEENRHKACHYLNMQPMWFIDNIIKSNKEESYANLQ